MSTHSEAMHAPAGLDHCPFMPTYGAPAVRMVKGEGCRLWDEDGNEYLDFLAGSSGAPVARDKPTIAPGGQSVKMPARQAASAG